MNQTSRITGHAIDTAIQNERIMAMEQQVIAIVGMVNQAARETEARIIVLDQHLDKLGWRVDRNAELLAQGITGNAISVERLKAEDAIQDKRIEKLEAVLRDVTRCLIDGKVNVAGSIPGELHRHRILGTESVQAMVEVYHRLKAQMGAGHDTP